MVTGQYFPDGHGVHPVSPSSEYVPAVQSEAVVSPEHDLPAGHLIQAACPAVLISSAAQATQSPLTDDPLLGLAVPAAHAVLAAAPPAQL